MTVVERKSDLFQAILFIIQKFQNPENYISDFSCLIMSQKKKTHKLKNSDKRYKIIFILPKKRG